MRHNLQPADLDTWTVANLLSEYAFQAVEQHHAMSADDADALDQAEANMAALADVIEARTR